MDPDRKSGIRVDVDGVLRKLKHLDLTGSVQYNSKYPIAQGGFGDVFKGQYDQLDGTTTCVAIKRLRTYLSGQLDTTRVSSLQKLEIQLKLHTFHRSLSAKLRRGADWSIPVFFHCWDT